MRRTTNFLLGLLLGGIIGASVAILMTPSSGKDLQSEIKKYIDTVQGEVQNAAHERRIELEKQLSTLREPKAPEKP